MEHPAVPEESSSTEAESNNIQKLEAPEDIFKAKSKLGELLRWLKFVNPCSLWLHFKEMEDICCSWILLRLLLFGVGY